MIYNAVNNLYKNFFINLKDYLSELFINIEYTAE